MDSSTDFPEPDDTLVWCERCRKMHKRVTFSRVDYERVISDGAKAMAAAIDAKLAEDFYKPESK